jgi:hypothetical protein
MTANEVSPMQTRLMTITPKLAAEFLEKNYNNRPINRAAVEEHVKNLRAGKFFATHQGIAFDEEDRLRDGQTRLMAIVESGVPARMLVTTGLTEEAVLAIDDGRRRTQGQALSMHAGEYVRPFITAIAREMFAGNVHLSQGGRRRKPSRQELLAFYDKYAEEINYAASCFKNHDSGLALGFVAAVVARAAVAHKGRRLDHFAKVLAEGFGKEGDEIVIRLRNHILQQRRGQRRDGGQRDQLYAKIERVLFAYLNREELNSVQSAKSELFPLDEDPKSEAGSSVGE